MLHVRSFMGVFSIAVCSVLLIPSTSPAEFQILSQSAFSDAAAQETTFKLTFNQPPQLTKTDSIGRPLNSFQYLFDSCAGDPEISGASVVVIRGPEIRFNHDIPIRNSENPTGKDFPNAEGWGAIRGSIPFDLDDNKLAFTVPWNLLGQTNRQFSYDLIALDRGSETSQFSAVSIGLPSSLHLSASLFLLAGFAWYRMETRMHIAGNSHPASRALLRRDRKPKLRPRLRE